jgi:hypothetical protein
LLTIIKEDHQLMKSQFEKHTHAASDVNMKEVAASSKTSSNGKEIYIKDEVASTKTSSNDKVIKINQSFDQETIEHFITYCNELEDVNAQFEHQIEQLVSLFYAST